MYVRSATAGVQSTTMVLTGSPSSSGSDASTMRNANGNSWPCRPPRFLRTANRVSTTFPFNSLSPRQANTRSAEASLLEAPRVPASKFLPKWSTPSAKQLSSCATT